MPPTSIAIGRRERRLTCRNIRQSSQCMHRCMSEGFNRMLGGAGKILTKLKREVFREVSLEVFIKDSCWDFTMCGPLGRPLYGSGFTGLVGRCLNRLKQAISGGYQPYPSQPAGWPKCKALQRVAERPCPSAIRITCGT